MSTHLTPAMLNCLADDELSAEQLAAAQQHLDTCPVCTSRALSQTLLKRAIARSGQRYAVPADLAERLKKRTESPLQQSPAPASRGISQMATAGWAAAAVLALASILVMQSTVRHSRAASTEDALVTEVSDLHVSTLAANQPPQVVSTDRHTVKPWFQGKLPFSFNLPQNLPADVTLEGANLTYLQGQPVAQLLYSVGRHRASVFLRQRTAANEPIPTEAEHSGFHVSGFRTGDLQVVAVSDVDPGRLADLAKIVEQAQTPTPK